jgi:rRNA pseudouridine-1189 N-methylase Emg1 (Nep1/Mra1 family)
MSKSEQKETHNEKIAENPGNSRQVIIILDMAQLETVKTKKGDFELLNCDDHINIMKKHGKDPQLYRPDILHQVCFISNYMVWLNIVCY